MAIRTQESDKKLKEVSAQLKEAAESKDRDLDKMKSGVEAVGAQLEGMGERLRAAEADRKVGLLFIKDP